MATNSLSSSLSASKSIRLGLLATVALAAFLGVAALHEKLTRPVADFSPVVQTSALEGWTPTFDSSPAAVAPSAAMSSATENPATASPATANPATASPATPAPAPASVKGAPTDTAPFDPDGDDAACSAMPAKWMVIGWDGADWDLVLPLLEAGKLPNFERLMSRGTYGTLHSIVPTLSPAIWTTVATGVAPDRHGILHFYNQRPRLERWWQRLTNGGELRRELYSNADRQVRAIWNHLSERDRKVLMVGYHNTFPVEEVQGMMVSNYLVQDSVAASMQMESTDSGLAAGLVYPQESLNEVLEIQRQVNRQIPEVVDQFIDSQALEGGPEAGLTELLRRSRRLDPDTNQRPYFLVHAWAFDNVVAEVAARFLPRIDADLSMVHFQSLDWAAHRFLYFHDPEAFGAMDWSPEERQELEADEALYRGTVEAFYVHMDDWLGRLQALRGPDTGLLLLSDHGFEPDADPHISGGHDAAPPGILLLEGPGIRRGHRLQGASVYDILPTLMTGLGLPVAEDLPGQPLAGAFCEAAWNAAEHSIVASYAQDQPFVPNIPRPEGLDQELLEQLESLGYLN